MKHTVAKVGEVQNGQCKLVEIEGKEIGVFFVDGEHRAYRNMCPHAGAPLCAGGISSAPLAVNVHEYAGEADTIRCPWHGWEFDLKTGDHLVSRAKLKTYEVSVEGDDVIIEVP
ncbi:MAG TPA: Rieske 2Fe-2S domain-containing protein [Abditibacteriaceae bacterium]|jgi:nitrite reductase/ring-hydroxylating ferredoxin subunit